MSEQTPATPEVHRTVRRVKGYWRRSGMPLSVRRRNAEELRDHLVAAVDDGRSVQEVVGADVTAFAAEWAQAQRARPWVQPLLWVIGVATFAPGLLALLGPLLFDEDRAGFDSGTLAFVGCLLTLSIAFQLLRQHRHRLTTQQAAATGLVLVVTYAVLFLSVVPWAERAERFFAIDPPLAWSLLAIGGLIQLVLARSWGSRAPARASGGTRA